MSNQQQKVSQQFWLSLNLSFILPTFTYNMMQFGMPKMEMTKIVIVEIIEKELWIKKQNQSVSQCYYTLSHSENDRDVTERIQEYIRYKTHA